MAYAIFAASAGGPEVLERRDIEPPALAEGEALIRQTAVGLNYIDVYHRSGLYPFPDDRPRIIGGEAAGVVEEVGAGVEALAPGDRVAYVIPLGAYASHRTAPADRLVRVPDEVADEVAAAAMLKGLTARYLIHDCYRVGANDTALVHAAAGGVGLILGQWLAAKGATAIGTVGSREKAELAAANGYAEVLRSGEGDLAAEVRRLTGGRGVDVVYDGVGRDTWVASLDSLRRRGVFVSFGQSSGMIEGFSMGELAKRGSLVATRPSLFDFIAEREDLERAAADLFAAIASGAVKIAVNQTFPLADAAEAHRALEGRRTTGSTVLIP